jgi:accessory colonization factor AcfC
MKMVWLLWGSSKTEIDPWVEAVFDDQVLAEMHLRLLREATADSRGFHYWIQEKQITKA